MTRVPTRLPGHVMLLFAGVLLPLFSCALLAEDVLEKEGFSFDAPLMLFMHRHATTWLDTLMVCSTHAGSALFLVPFNLLVAAWLLWRREAACTWFWLLSVGGAALLNLLAKLSFGRARPSLWVPHLAETTYSFPSGHSMQSMAVGAALVCLVWRAPARRSAALALGAVFPLLVGTSRIYLAACRT